MKQLKKAVLFIVCTFVMLCMADQDVKAELMNVPSALVWEQGYTSIDGSGDYYQYSMSLQESGKVTFTTQAEKSGLYSRFEVRDSSNKTVWQKTIKKGLNLYTVYLLAGDYTVIVNDVRASWTPSFVPSGETISEHYMNNNNQVGTATPYAIGTTVKGFFADNDDTDIYKVMVSKAGNLTVQFSNEIASMNMTIACPDENITYSEKGIPNGASSYQYFVPKGTYYISFDNKNGGNTYNGTYNFSTKLSGITTTKVKSAKNLKGGKAKVTWMKKADAAGYQVQVAVNKQFTKNKKNKEVSGQNVSNYTFTNLKKGKTYYARVRTYKLIQGKKYYSDWSAAKKFKVTK